MSARARVAAGAGALVAASALAVAIAVWLPLADFWFFPLDSTDELARAELKIAPSYDGWPAYVVGGGVVAVLAAAIAVRDVTARPAAAVLVLGWLWFSAVGLAVVVTVPGGIDPPAGTCYGVSEDPADYWGAESWRLIEPAYEAAAARDPEVSLCWDVDHGPAAVVALVASLVGVTAAGFAIARLRGWRRPVVAALAATLLPATVWVVAWLLEALSHLA